MQEIQATDISTLNSKDEDILLNDLVAQFLVHDGYIEAAKTFATEVEQEASALGKTVSARIRRTTTEDDLDASNRQRRPVWFNCVYSLMRIQKFVRLS